MKVLLVLSAIVLVPILCGQVAVPGDPVEEAPVTKREILADVYPEVLAVVDRNLSTKIGGTDDDIKTYIRRLYGSVQRVYDSIKQPRFHFQISDIFICRKKTDCPYVSDNQHGDKLEVDNSGLLDEMRAWAAKKRATINFDIMMTFTSLEMCRIVNADGTCPRGVGLAGKSYLGGACGGYNVGIVTDGGGFESVKVTAHEMGHLFGAEHDGTGAASACDGRDGYIMGGSSKPENLFRASPCTIRSFAKFVSGTKGTCLTGKGISKYEIDYALPGSLKSTDEQCKQKYGPLSKNCPFMPNSDVCNKHWCYYPSTGTCRTNGAAFSGTPCDSQNTNKVPTVDVDLSDVAKSLQPSKVTTPPTNTICKDSEKTHLKLSKNGKMTNCKENYKLYPVLFCSTEWVRSYCCATVEANCDKNVVG